MKSRRLPSFLACLLLCVPSLSLAGLANFRRGDSDADGRVDITDPIFTLGVLFLGNPKAVPCKDAADANDDGRVDITDPINTLGMLFLGDSVHPAPGPFQCGIDPTADAIGCDRYQACAQGSSLTTIVRTSPRSGEEGVAVTRETILYFSGPIDPATVSPLAVNARFGGDVLFTDLHLSADLKVLTIFYAEPLSPSSRIRVSVEGDLLRDPSGQAVDADGDGSPGGVFTLDFDTLTLTTLEGTAAFGRVFASELGDGGVHRPLAGVVITVDGTEDLPAPLRTMTDAQGNFRLAGAPAGRFFVGIDGRPVTGGYPTGDYYPVVGKAWSSIPGEETNIGDVFLPLIVAGTLQRVSESAETVITFPPSVLAAHPELEGVHVAVPAGSLYFDNGSPGSSVGIAPVAPDRLPAPLPPGLEFPLVITVQTDGAQNFDVPAPACFPNLPDPATGKPLAPGQKAYLYSFNHDTGSFGPIGFMTASGDGKLVCTDPGVGILAPGWHAVGPVPREPPPCVNAYCGDVPLFVFEDPAGGGGGALSTAGGNGGGVSPALHAFRGMVLQSPKVCDAQKGASCAGTAGRLYNAKRAEWSLGFHRCLKAGGSRQRCSGERGDGRVSIERWYLTAKETCDSIYTDPCLGAPGGGAGAPPADPISAAIEGIEDQIGPLLEPFGPEDPIPEEVSAQIDRLLADADRAAGGSAESYLSLRLAAFERDLAAGQEDFPYLLGNAPPSPVHYLAEVSRLDGSALELRGETMPYGFYSLFVPADGEVRQVSFYDARTKQLGLEFPFRTARPPQVFYPLQLFPVEGLPDRDRDGLPDAVESIYGTDPFNPDSDGDGLPDGAEVDQGLNPLDGRPAKTGIVATAGIPGIAVDVCAVNDLAVVAASEAGVAVLNVFQGLDPRIIALVDTPGTALAVACSGERLAVADGDAGLAVIDIADPPAARIVHEFPLAGSTRAVAAAGGIAYGGTSNGEVIALDLSSGGELGRLQLSKPIEDLAIERDTLYVLVEGTLFSIPILDAPFRVLGSTATSGTIPSPGRMRLFVGGGIAYAVYLEGYGTIDVHDPGHPKVISGASTRQVGWKQIALNGSGLGVAAVGTLAGFQGPQDISLFDTRDPAKTNEFLTLFPMPGIARSVSIYNGLAYVATHDRGLEVLNYLPYDAKKIAPAISLEASFSLGSAGAEPQAEEGKLARVTANVTDDVQVRNVEFFVDGARIATDGSFPFEAQFATPLLKKQSSFTLRARATDTGGNSVETGPIEVEILPDATAPWVTRFEPRAHTRRADTVSTFFSEPMDPGTMDETTLRIISAGPDGLSGTGDDVPIPGGSLNYREEVRALILKFSSPLGDGLYQAIVSAGFKDLTGHPLPEDFSWTFTVDSGSVLWVGPSGQWHDPVNWSVGRLPRAGERVIIDVGEDVTVEHSQGTDSIESLFSNEAVVLSGSGALSVSGTVQVNNRFVLHGGTLADARILPGTNGEGITLETNSAFRNVRLDADLSLSRGETRLTVSGGLVLGGRLLLAGGSGSAFVLIYFNDPTEQLLDGSGEIVFLSAGSNYVSLPPGATLRISKDITIHGHNGSVGGSGAALINEGTIHADGIGTVLVQGTGMRNAGTIKATGRDATATLNGTWTNSGRLEARGGSALSLLGEWRNDGTIFAEDSTVYLGGTFKLGDLGDFQHPGSTVAITGTLVNQTGLVLDAATGSFELVGGTIQGGTIATEDGSYLLVRNGALDGVTLEGEMEMVPSDFATRVRSGLTVNGKLTMAGGSGSSSAYLYFDGSAEQTLSGSGELLFWSGGTPGNVISPSSGAPWRIGSGITVHGFNGTIGNASSPFVNQGTIHSDFSGGLIVIAGQDWRNDGLIRSSSGGSIFTQGFWTNHGTVAVGAQSPISPSVYTQDASGVLKVDVSGPGQAGKLQVSGTATLAGTLAVELAPGFEPALGSRFDVLTGGALAGKFNTLAGGAIGNGLGFSIEYGPDKVTLVVVQQ